MKSDDMRANWSSMEGNEPKPLSCRGSLAGAGSLIDGARTMLEPNGEGTAL